MARYLLGIVLVNQQDFANAIEIFEDLIDEESYPWTAPQTTFIQNNSLLKLAYIRYELGEYQLALNYFSKVSPGFSGYDKSLLGAAWANFKLGNYPQTIENVNQLLQDYLASNYTYEALILSAHSKNLLKQQDSALQDYRYVATAQRVLELSDFYNNERKLILDQLTEVEQIEEEILERGDKDLYEVTSQIRDHLHKMLLQFQHRSGTGDSVFEGFVTERDSILQQIEYLDNIIAQASETSETDVANAAYQQRERLMKVLEVFQADSSIHNTNYFIEYPLATKEGTVKYRMAILSDLVQQIDNERRRIRDNLERAERLQGKNAYYTANLNAKFDLEILENELKHLKHRSSQLQAWLVDNQVQDLNTNFDKWADLSGFGISEITFQNIKERDERISDLSTNINSINQILQERRKSLEQKLVELDEQIEQIEEKLRKQKIENEKKKTESYFNESYFDFKGTEDEGVETLIPPNNSNEPN
jgi:tetratricopeptide (TPR) repeat protein